VNDIEAAPAGAEHVDAVGAGLFEKDLPRMRVDFRRRERPTSAKSTFIPSIAKHVKPAS
jgi:hypothetical protein